MNGNNQPTNGTMNCLADEIYALNLRHIDAYIVSQAVTWAYNRDRKEMSEIADCLKTDNAYIGVPYVGQLLAGLVKDYLADSAFQQAEKEVADERNDG